MCLATNGYSLSDGLMHITFRESLVRFGSLSTIVSQSAQVLVANVRHSLLKIEKIQKGIANDRVQNDRLKNYVEKERFRIQERC